MVTITSAKPIFFEFATGVNHAVNKVEVVDFMDIAMVNVNRTVTIEKIAGTLCVTALLWRGLYTLTVSHVLPHAGERRRTSLAVDFDV
ncbi:hypothetical protein M8494_01135 [Serratia ureilytica]